MERKAFFFSELKWMGTSMNGSTVPVPGVLAEKRTWTLQYNDVLETLGKGMLQIQSFYCNPLILLFFLREVAPSTWMRKSQIMANWSPLTDW